MVQFKLSNISLYSKPLKQLPDNKLLINTLNAHCYNLAQNDLLYQETLLKSDILIPDGVGIVKAVKWLTGQKITKIAGADLFFYEMERLQNSGGKCFFLGSTENTLSKIKERVMLEYPGVKVETWSPPYKLIFTEEDNKNMLLVINSFKPDVLMIGMTAPKQEKWAYQNYNHLNVGHICCIGAVFDFYSGTIKRAPNWMIRIGMEWLYRLLNEPRRLWRRYLIGNMKFIYLIIKEKLFLSQI